MIYKEDKKSVENIKKRKEELYKDNESKINKSKSYFIKKIYSEITDTVKESGLKRALFKIKCRINKKLIFDKQTIFNIDEPTEYKYHFDYSNKKIAIYTAIFGGYDKLQEPLYINPMCDYYVFTDQDVDSESVWKKIPISSIPNYSHLDSYHLSKIVKILPHLFFQKYDYSIWVDGTTLILADLMAFIDKMDYESKYIAMFDNPVHDSIYTEANFLIYYNRVSEKDIKKQVDYYRSCGYPDHNGMFECTIIVRKHTDESCKKIMEDWWKQINQFTMRDQISFPFVLWRNNLNFSDVCLLGENRNYNPRIKFENHIKTNKYTR